MKHLLNRKHTWSKRYQVNKFWIYGLFILAALGFTHAETKNSFGELLYLMIYAILYYTIVLPIR